MLTFIGLIVVFFSILHQRSTGIVVVNPLRDQSRAPAPGAEDGSDEAAPDSVPDFARLLSTIQQAAQNAPGRTAQLPPGQGRDAIVKLVQNNQFIEAMQLYRRIYGVDLQAAKKAVDKLMLER